MFVLSPAAKSVTYFSYVILTKTVIVILVCIDATRCFICVEFMYVDLASFPGSLPDFGLHFSNTMQPKIWKQGNVNFSEIGSECDLIMSMCSWDFDTASVESFRHESLEWGYPLASYTIVSSMMIWKDAVTTCPFSIIFLNGDKTFIDITVVIII